MTQSLFRILYCSRNVMDPASSAVELAEILAVARRNNQRQGVTGALLYNDGLFVQTLEGSFDAVQGIFEQIQVDDRHGDVVVLEAKSVSERLFGEWAMALAQTVDPQSTNTILTAALVSGSGDGPAVLKLLDRIVNHEVAHRPVHA